MKSSILINGFIVSLSLTGCVPNATSYYRPTVSLNSHHEKTHCVPLEKYVHFTLITERGSLNVRGSGSIYTSSKGKQASGQYVISGNWEKIEYENDAFSLIAAGATERIKPTEIFGEEHEYKNIKTFNLEAVFLAPKTDNFDVIFPKLRIDGIEVRLPVLHIKKTIWVGISPFNC